ncbi:MAG: RsmD family RNA methyltransferase [Marinilabiliales bacterium]|nr:RsmD family RNA methyltransferase [Marinilabiliales bacterium]
MRIIGGELKGRQIQPGKNFKARPTTDFARENLFNILANRVDFEELSVLDLFAGTGSISYEFASRGCKSVTSVELDAVHMGFINRSIQQLNLEKCIRTVRYDVLKFIPRCTEKYDLIFADPPYQLPHLSEIPDLILKHELLSKEGFLILEHGKNNQFSDHPALFEQRIYGSVHFSFFKNPAGENVSI